MDDVKFSKNSMYARNKIKTNKDIASWLTVPVCKGSTDLLIKDVTIAETDWPRKHSRLIKTSYSSSPFFHDYWPFFEKLYQQNWKYLADLNVMIIKQAAKWFNLQTKIVIASDFADFSGDKSERLISYCTEFGANSYIFGASGRNYADGEMFNSKSIKVMFQHYLCPSYQQQFGKFIGNLSFIDYLFNCGNDNTWNIGDIT